MRFTRSFGIGDDTEHDNDETYQHQWRIDTEGILDLIVVYA